MTADPKVMGIDPITGLPPVPERSPEDKLRTSFDMFLSGIAAAQARHEALRAENAALRGRLERLVEAASILRRMIDDVPLKEAHAAFCNGVHAPDGQCEGMHWLSRAEDDLEKAIAAAKEPTP